MFKTIICNLERLKMDKLKIDTWRREKYTVGVLTYKDFTCMTLELPWLDNQTDISCIPRAGAYIGRKHLSPTNGDCIAIENVLNREDIQIHSLNWLYETKGCIGVGRKFNPDTENGPMITSSVNTLNELLSMLPDKFTIEIT